MKIENHQIIETLEELGKLFPWDTVELDLTRKPEGNHSFWAYIHKNDKLGFDSLFIHGDSLQDIIAQAQGLAKRSERDPEISRLSKIRQLQEAIAKLQAVVIGLPPYRPNRELGAINTPTTVDL